MIRRGLDRSENLVPAGVKPRGGRSARLLLDGGTISRQIEPERFPSRPIKEVDSW
jgi:hypothetical protein